MTRAEYLYQRATIKRCHAEGRIDTATMARRLTDLTHLFAGVALPDAVDLYVSDTMRRLELWP